MSTIALASNPVLHARTKHIELDIHFVRDKVKEKRLELRYVPTSDQIADVLTKALGYQFFSRLRNKMTICPSSTIELRGSVSTTTLNTNQDMIKVKEKKHDIAHANKEVAECAMSSMNSHPMYPTWKEVLTKGS